MTQSRQSQVSLSDTPYYHCISRCVRRAYLCGENKYTEKTFEQSRQWVIERKLMDVQVYLLCLKSLLHFFSFRCCGFHYCVG